MTDEPREHPSESVTQGDASDAPFPPRIFVVLVIAAIVFPPLGILVGAFNMDKPSRRRQSQILMAIGIGIIVIYVLASA